MEFETYKQAAKYINEAYASPDLRKFIFGLEEISHHYIKGIGAINKILTVEFLVIYLRWFNTDRNTLRSYKSEHFERASEVMRNLYRSQKFDLDVIVYVLSEGQKDIRELGERSFFYPLIDASVPCDLGKIYGMIDDWMNDLQTAEDNVDKIRTFGFIPTVKMAKALTKTVIKVEKNDGVLTTTMTFDGEPIKTWDVIYTDSVGRRFVLLDVGYEREDAHYHYMTIDDLSHETVIKKANRR
jgi:hypothetical protein